MAVQRDIKKVEVPIFNFEVPVSQNNTFPVQFRIINEDGTKVSAWSNVYEVPGPTVTGGDVLTIKTKSLKLNIAWEDDDNRVLYDVFVHRFSDIFLGASTPQRSVTISRPSTTTAQMTLYDNTTTRNPPNRQEHHLKVGMRIAITNVPGGDYNISDTYVTSVPDPYTFVYSPVPTTNMPAATFSTSGQISIHSNQSDVITNVEDYSFQFVGRTNKNTFSTNIGTVISRSASGSERVNTTVTDVWCLVQNASADKKANNALDIATGHIPI
jgi:hypothetical protein